MIRYRCISCGRDMESPASLTGSQESCSYCGTVNVVPQIARDTSQPQSAIPPVQPQSPIPPVQPQSAVSPAQTVNPYAPPPMPQYAAPVAVQTVYAGFWLRFVAMIIDQLILLVAGAAGGFVIGLIIGFTMATGGADLVEIQGVAELIGNIFGILIAWLYYAGMESSRKMATLGKMALGLIVTDMSGRRISFGRATGRHFGKIISALLLCIGYFMAGFTQRKQALHDIMASCLVLRRK